MIEDTCLAYVHFEQILTCVFLVLEDRPRVEATS